MHRGNKLKSPSIFLGYSFKRGNPEPWKFFKINHLMVNAYDIMKKNIEIRDMHKSLSYEGTLFCDSGGWQIIQGANNVKIAEIVSAQEKINADHSAVLDHGLNPQMHLEYLRYYIENADFDFIPIIPYDLPDKFIKKFQDLIEDPDIIGIGKLVPILRPPINYEELKKAIVSILKIKKSFSDSQIHIFGLGGLYTMLILFLIVDSSDTSSWIHDAIYGKIRLVGGNGTYSTHPRHALKHIKKEWYNCNCPICRKFTVEELDARGTTGSQLRAIHNAWVFTEEEKIIKEMKESEKYINYIEKRIRCSPQHRKLFEFVKKQLAGNVIT